MKNYETLIRLHRFTLDRLKREIAAAESEQQEILRRVAMIDAEVAAERDAAAIADPSLSTFAAYAEAAGERKVAALTEAAGIESMVERLRDALNLAYQEVKKYELLAAEAEKRAAEGERRAETAALDEVATARFLRAAREG